MKYRRCQFSGDFVHVRQHQHQALRRGEGRGQCTSLQGAMDRTGGTAFVLHFHHGGHMAPDIRNITGGPFIRQFRHRG